MSNSKRQTDLIAFTVTGSDETPFFTKIGAAWKNSKGGYGIRLEAMPIGGEIVLLPPKDRSENTGAAT